MTNEVKTPTTDALRTSIEASGWLTKSDSVAVALAINLAAEMDIAIAMADSDRIIALSPRLLDVLKQLHLTPETRTQGKQQDEQDGSDHLGNYLRLIAAPVGNAKSESAKRRASSK